MYVQARTGTSREVKGSDNYTMNSDNRKVTYLYSETSLNCNSHNRYQRYITDLSNSLSLSRYLYKTDVCAYVRSHCIVHSVEDTFLPVKI